MSNINFSTATTSLDSINSLQNVFELDGHCNVYLQGRIGQGFYGEVYRGTLEYFDTEKKPREVAVKKLKTNGPSAHQADFQREIDIMTVRFPFDGYVLWKRQETDIFQTLKHVNVVEILGILHDPDLQLVMEFVPHGSLQSYLKIYKDRLTVPQLLNYASGIAAGMDYLGTKNIVHRDLAARNILVVDEKTVKISDFGLAQSMGTSDYYYLKTTRDLPLKWLELHFFWLSSALIDNVVIFQVRYRKSQRTQILDKIRRLVLWGDHVGDVFPWGRTEPSRVETR